MSLVRRAVRGEAKSFGRNSIGYTWLWFDDFTRGAGRARLAGAKAWYGRARRAAAVDVRRLLAAAGMGEQKVPRQKIPWRQVDGVAVMAVQADMARLVPESWTHSARWRLGMPSKSLA